MKNLKLIFITIFISLSVQAALAIPTAEEAAQLGKTLTPFGAIKAGNADGSIPEWTGGLCTPPADYKPNKGLEAGGGPYADPFASDKPIIKITAANLEKYKDQLDEGTKTLLRRFPDTFSVNVFPTRRTACFANWMYQNTIKRVMNPKITDGKAPGIVNAHAQIPFPIPKTGVEAMWNSMLKPEASVHTRIDQQESHLIDSGGNSTMTVSQNVYLQNNYWDNTISSLPESKPFWALIAKTLTPASSAGGMTLLHYNLRHDLRDPAAWSYIPGQRRVRLAPEFSYDGVDINTGGILLYDEVNGFSGKMDRYNFQLVGKKEMIVPYNAYAFYRAPAKIANGPKHLNSDILRFEKHRVWIVEATLKSGERHVQKKKVFYIDEDSWNILVYVGSDHSDKPHHLFYPVTIQAYDGPRICNSSYFIYDFSKSAYTTTKSGADHQTLIYKVPPFPANYFTAESMAGMGLR